MRLDLWFGVYSSHLEDSQGNTSVGKLKVLGLPIYSRRVIGLLPGASIFLDTRWMIHNLCPQSSYNLHRKSIYVQQ
jgi:hypothetical protein